MPYPEYNCEHNDILYISPVQNFHHTNLLPQTLNLAQAQQVLGEHFGNCVLIGVDEAGRGPLAGPVVAAAVILKAMPPLLNDSKKLTEKQREHIFCDLPAYCEHHCISEASAAEIDEIGILNATFLAMRRSIEEIVLQLNKKNLPYKILIDGNLYIRELDCALQMPIIKGDGRVACIAAASVFAKVHRDGLMRELAGEFPQYGFEKHKGYGTKTHIDAIKKFGQCKIHRKSFKIPI